MERLDELAEELSNGLFPIVYLRFSSRNSHAVVVVNISSNLVSVLDPEIGERVFEISEFREIWFNARATTIVQSRLN